MKTILALTLLLASTAQAEQTPWPTDIDMLIAGSGYMDLMTSPFPASPYVSSARDIWAEIERRKELRRKTI